MKNEIIVFVCEHGSAKSIIAATYFNQLAEQANLHVRAIARGTDPDKELSLQTVAGLDADGLTPTETIPQKLSPADIENAQLVVTFCEIPEEYQNKVILERWDDVPPVSENYESARDEIITRLKQLFKS